MRDRAGGEGRRSTWESQQPAQATGLFWLRGLQQCKRWDIRFATPLRAAKVEQPLELDAATANHSASRMFTLLCYPLLGGVPPIRPASAKRSWMDDTTESFAVACP
jgi:hypothetical protein